MSLFRREKIIGRSEEQIHLMRVAGLLVGRTLEMLRGEVRAGRTTKELDTIAETFIRDHDGVPSFLGYHGFAGSICTSVNEEIVHGIPGPRVLEDGDLLSIDCGAIVLGWHGDAAISLVVGGPEAARPEDLALIEATEDGLYAGIAALQVGAGLYAVGAAVEDSLLAAGAADGSPYGIVEDYVGHGIGTEMHMPPQVPNYRCDEPGPRVVEGTTIAIEPMITLDSPENEVLADGWTVVTVDKKRAAHWEHTVAATSAGLWVLTALDGGKSRLGSAYAPLG